MSTNAGDLELAFGVALRASSAKYGSSEQRLAFFNVFFTTKDFAEQRDSYCCYKLN